MLDLFLTILTVCSILLLGLSPFLLQLAQRFGLLPQSRLQRRLEQRLSRRLTGAGLARSVIAANNLSVDEPETRYVEGVGFVIGDLSCRFNGRSPLLRCAINPLGPCAGCHSYETNL